MRIIVGPTSAHARRRRVYFETGCFRDAGLFRREIKRRIIIKNETTGRNKLLYSKFNANCYNIYLTLAFICCCPLFYCVCDLESYDFIIILFSFPSFPPPVFSSFLSLNLLNLHNCFIKLLNCLFKLYNLYY